MSARARPNFFLVGGPKCGTTAMYTYLQQHPDVFMPERKEPHYFCPDLYSPRYVHDEATYLALFGNAGGHRRIGEASVYYLYSREAARRIRAFAPEAHILIMLRNPIDMVHSLHSQRLYSGHENIEDFPSALAAEPDRKAGRRLPPDPYPIPCLFYREVGRYAGQVRRFLEVFPPPQVHVVIYDDFAQDTAGAFAGVCRFLGLEAGFGSEFDVYNPNKKVRSTVLRDLLKFYPQTKTWGRRLVPRALRQRIVHRLVVANTRYETRQPMPAGLRLQLADEFRSDVHELSALVGRDLTPWLAASGGADMLADSAAGE